MRLLLAVDLNDAEDIVALGAKWAERLGARLDLVYVDEHAYDAYLVQDPAVHAILDREWRKIRLNQEERLRGVLDTLPETMRGEAWVRTGRASDEIVEAGKDRDAVLIGTHGRKGLSHLVLGSVAERVVRTSPVPVLVLKRPAQK